MESVFELEKKILKAQSPEEIDEITKKNEYITIKKCCKIIS